MPALVAVALAPCAGSGSTASAQAVDFIATVQSSGGEYVFDRRTVSHSLLTGVSMLVADRWRFGATIAVIAQDNGGLSYVGGQLIPTGGRNSSDKLALGDPVVSAGFDLYRSRGMTSRLSAQLLAKIPVATVESGVGTEAFDYGGGASFSAGFGRVFGYADASYWVLGDMPELELNDILSGSAGLGLLVGRDSRWSVMASVAGGGAAIRNVEGPLSVGASVGRMFSPRQALNAGVAFGLSEGSPDWSAHLGFRVSSGR